MRFLRFMVFALAVLPFAASSVMAADITIVQDKKKFSKKRITASVGDTIVLVNKDSFTHNLYSKKGAKVFDSGSLKTSSVYKITLDKAGKFVARCAIHPKMKLRVTVK